MLRVALFVVVAVAAILASMVLLRPEVDEASNAVGTSSIAEPDRVGVPVPDPFAAAQAEYVDATARLRGALDEQVVYSDAELIEPLEENLGFLEQAVVEVMIALAENPENVSLRQRLLNMYEEQVNLLQKALRLTGDE